MTIDEIKAKLIGADEEGADRAGIYDEVLSEVAAQIERADAAEAKISEVMSRVAELEASNMKLLDKIRYVEAEEQVETPEETEDEVMTIEELFEED